MREDPGTNGREAFENGLLACARDLNELLPELSRRYDMAVIISALAEHVGSALRILQRCKVCDAGQARLVIKRIEGTAFLGKNAQLKTSGTPPGAAALGRGAPDGSPDSPAPKNPTRH